MTTGTVVVPVGALVGPSVNSTLVILFDATAGTNV